VGNFSQRSVEQRPPLDWYRLAGMVVLLLVIGGLWWTPLLYPLRLLVVFFHEMSHALVGLLTGGHVVRIELDPLEGGLTLVQGGSQFLMLSAGYLGSLVWGGVILTLAARLDNCKPLTGILGLILALASLIWIRPLLGFGFLFCALSAAGLLWFASHVHHDGNSLLLRIIGLTSLLYVPLDILDDTILRSGLRSDARLLAELTLIPTVVWGTLWCGLSLWLVWRFVLAVARTPGLPTMQRSQLTRWFPKSPSAR
jgi:hypothetical protein